MRITRMPCLPGGLLVLLLLTACGGGGGRETEGDETPVVATIAPGQGISIQQVDFQYPEANHNGSTWGRLLLDRETLRRAANLGDGFVSVVTAEGWAVRNVPVPAPGEPPHAVYFDLGLDQPETLSNTQVEIKHSNAPLQDIRPHLEMRVPFPVERWIYQARGLGPSEDVQDVTVPEKPPQTFALDDVQELQTLTVGHFQPVTNVQCAWNQCFPMAIANGLQFLEDGGRITVADDHDLGIGILGDPTLDMLVGQLDFYASRHVVSRSNGHGVWFTPMIDGTFDYLRDHGLDGTLTWRHQDRGYGQTIPSGDYSTLGSTSLDDGATVSWDWIDDRITGGCAVAMVYTGHAVRVTGSGKTLGLPWIRYSHDALQLDDEAGLEDVLTFLSDPDGNGLLNMDGSSLEIRWVWAACP